MPEPMINVESKPSKKKDKKKRNKAKKKAKKRNLTKLPGKRATMIY